MTQQVIVITGCTAIGKSSFAEIIADKIGGVIINADAMQVYKNCPILSAQPPNIDDKYKLYSIINGDEYISVANWLNMVEIEIENAVKSNITPIIVGGTAMYVRSLIDGVAIIPKVPLDVLQEIENSYIRYGLDYLREKLIKLDGELSEKLRDKQRIIRALSVRMYTGRSIRDFHSNRDNYHRVIDNLKQKYPIEIKKILLTEQKDTIKNNCLNRLQNMIQYGAIDEVQRLLDLNYSRNSMIFKTIGVVQIEKYLKNIIHNEQMIEEIMTCNMQYIKKQNTWFNNKFNDFIKYSVRNVGIDEVIAI